MQEGAKPEQSRRESRHSGHRRRRRSWMIVGIALLVLILGGVIGYWVVKRQRADRFAAVGDALLTADKWSEAAVQYRVALQLNPSSYRGLSGAARLAFTGKSESDGRIGEMIKIRNLRSNKIFQARVEGPDKAFLDTGVAQEN